MRDTRLVKWAKEVTRTPLLQTTTKVLLLDLYIDGMCQAGTVSVPRSAMADRMGVSARQIDRRITDAITVGFLELLTAGRKNTTAVYMVSDPECDAVPRPRRARSDRAPWRQSGAQRDTFKHPEASDSATRGGRAEPVDSTACRISARHAYVAPVVTRATAEPAHPNGVLADAGTCADEITVARRTDLRDVTPPVDGWLPRNLDHHLETIHPFPPITETVRASLSGQNCHQEDERPETQAKADLSTVDLAELAAGQAGQW